MTSQYFQEIQSKLDMPQITKEQRRIFMKEMSFTPGITKIRQMRLVWLFNVTVRNTQLPTFCCEIYACIL